MSVRTLRTTAEFQAHYQTGRKIVTTYFVVFSLPSTDLIFGVVASGKTVGTAVRRNRAKRRLRELFRLAVKDNLLTSGSYVFVARESIVKTPMAKIAQEFARCLKKLS